VPSSPRSDTGGSGTDAREGRDADAREGRDADAVDRSRPADHVDGAPAGTADTAGAGSGTGSDEVAQPRLGPLGTLRFVWRQLTSMRTALLLLLLLAVAAVPGSLFPQRSSDPNGVIQYRAENPDLFGVLDRLQLFDVYTSAWFSAIYLLLFISLIGCVIPRTRHHLAALRARPPRTPARFSRLPVSREEPPLAGVDRTEAIDRAQALLERQGYRVERYTTARSDSVSAERGYLRETGNLIFHTALLGVLVTVGVGAGFSYTGQRVIVQGTSFTNVGSSYDSLTTSRFFSDASLVPYSIRLDDFTADYGLNASTGQAQALDFTADVTTTTADGDRRQQQVKVNEPLAIADTNVYLLGNGFAPVITVRDPDGTVVFSQPVPFLPQDNDLTSLGVVKVPDAAGEDLAFLGFFYPTAREGANGALASVWPDPDDPVMTLNVYTGDLGLDDGTAGGAYTLDTDTLTQLSGRGTDLPGVQLAPGETAELPDGRGTISFDELRRFVSLDIHHDPTQGWVLGFVVAGIAGLITSLFVPRRRMWVKATTGDAGGAGGGSGGDPGSGGVEEAGGVRLEYAGLARGEDPGLRRAVDELAAAHLGSLGRGGDHGAPAPRDRTAERT